MAVHNRRAPAGSKGGGAAIKATIGGVPLLADIPVRWSVQTGVRPVIETLHIMPKDADRMEKIAKRGPVTLRMKVNGSTVEAKNLWIIDIPPTSNPHIQGVTVADRRWLWSFSHVRRLYNIRRQIGNKRIKTDTLPQLDPVAENLWYLPSSLNPPKADGKRWKAHEIIKDIMNGKRGKGGQERKGILDKETEKGGGQKARLVIDADIKDALPVDDLILDDSGEAALFRVLQYLPQADVTVDLDGTVRIFSKVGGGENAQLAKAGPEIVGDGHVDYITNNLTRPKEIHVLFTREVEVRFDYEEKESAVHDGAADELKNKRLLDNVLPVPDWQMYDVTDRGVGPFTAGTGTWVNIDAALRAWDNTAAPPAGNGGIPNNAGVNGNAQISLDHNFIQRAMVPFMDLWTGIGLAGMAAPDADWMARIAAIQAHYRRTFRINRKWMDRIESIRAYRAGTVDVATGTRAPALVWSDYSVLPSLRGFLKRRADMMFVMNRPGGIAPDAPIEAAKTPASADVVVVDSSQGIIRAEYKIDVMKNFDSVIPGIIADANDNPPNGNINKQGLKERCVMFNGNGQVQGKDAAPRLSGNHRVSFIVSCVPATPNSNRQLHRVVVKPQDVRDLLPGRMAEGLNDADAPAMEVRVQPGVEVARIRWLDDKRQEIEKIFGQREGEPNLAGLVLNHDPKKPRDDGASLTAISRAVAARVYGSMADRMTGTSGGFMTSAIKCDGWLKQAAFTIDPSGKATTDIQLEPQIPQMSMHTFLDESTRHILMRMPLAPKGGV